ncbi:hypothetical protein TIFTF001_051862 [Ficus carica]|uniref:Uncharacterized protein n=1 Tax=Ficus carica TaxID=3494 RepID=A0AA88EEJ4_FICCA|nr:hypothetical protein TIFTF001_051862 [Ficus carica]
MVFKIIICAAQKRARERKIYQFHRCRCGRLGSRVDGRGWVLRKRLEGGVAAEIGGEREKGTCMRENEWWSRGQRRLEARDKG